jgi:nitrate/TMAO reductase-like tetraheme cytochrome c subunit
MATQPPVERNRPGLILLTSHWLSWLGLAIVITAVSTWLFVLPTELREHVENPYKGAVVYLILPGVLFAGLGLVAVGILLGRRRIRERLRASLVDRRTTLQRLVAFLVIMVGANLLIGTQLTYRAVQYMDTPQFCGASCHAMRPQYVGHQDSNHASVACAECHVAPGAGGWIAAKMNGTRQLWQTLTQSYPRPVPPALESGRLVPARETCERCHWVDKIVGSRLVIVPSYAGDEKNTASYTVLMMLVGGSTMQGIHHAHFSGGFEIQYAATSPKRETIPWVQRRNTRTGETKTFLAEGTKPEQVQALPRYTMQCVDCHDRPTHGFLPADRALNRAIALGQVPADLPFIKKQGLAALEAKYSSSAEAAQKIPTAIESYYRQAHPHVYEARRTDIATAGLRILAIYNRHVFPDLNVTWGTYANNLGHTDSPGCSRCHDGGHAVPGGKDVITADCGACHQILAQDEAAPQILKTLGLWDHLVTLKPRS